MNVNPVHLLLVEDNPDHAELIRRQLEQLGFPLRLHHVEDGEAALDYVFGKGAFSDRSRFPEPNVVLLDLRLPRVDGLEVLRIVKSQPQFGKLPIIVLTSSDAENDVARSFELRADGFLTKPVDPDILPKTFSRLGFLDALVGAEILSRPNLHRPQ